MTSFTSVCHSFPSLRATVLVALVIFALATASDAAPLGAFDVTPGGVSAEAGPQPQSSGDPEANLPFLFAVYIITWAAFFGYVFYLSRRQRDMRGEIEALKRALTLREEAETADPRPK